MNPGDYFIVRHRRDDNLLLRLRVITMTIRSNDFRLEYECMCDVCGEELRFRLEELRQYGIDESDDLVASNYDLVLDEISCQREVECIRYHNRSCMRLSDEPSIPVSRPIGITNAELLKLKEIPVRHMCTINDVVEVYKRISTVVTDKNKQLALTDLVCGLYDSGYTPSMVFNAIPTIVKLHEYDMFKGGNKAEVIKKPTVRLIRED
jgi:hypothetical protein